MSDARRVSPSPRPTTSGEETFTPTSSPGASARQHDERVRALELATPRGGRPRRPASVSVASSVLDQVRDDLGVGLRREACGPPSQAACGAAGGSRRCRCGSRRRGRCSRGAGARSGRWARRASPSACGPSPIVPAGSGSSVERGLELAQLARALAHGESAVHDRDARRVVAAVLEPPETLDDDGERLVGPHVADDAAHVRSSVTGVAATGDPGRPDQRRAARARPLRPRRRASLASGSVAASTITRTSGSVPAGAHEHPAAVAEAPLRAGDRFPDRRPDPSADRDRRPRRSRSPAGTARIRSPSSPTAAAGRRGEREEPDRGQQPVARRGEVARRSRGRDCSPPSTAPVRCISSST